MEVTTVSGLLLTGLLLGAEPNAKGREAARYSSIATYHQSGLDKILAPKLQYIEKRYIPEFLRNFGVETTLIYRIVVDQKIEYRWSF